jgi:glucose/arabinose dehydrogenase
MTLHRSLLRLLAFALPCIGLFAGAPAQAAGSYRTSGDCDGFPKVSLRTPDGLCVGLVAAGLRFARGVAVIGDDIYVADMGSWEKGRGRLLRLPDGGHGAPQVLLTRLDRPNGLVATPDGRLLLGLAGRIVSVDPKADPPAAALQDVVTNLPNDGRHPLAALALAPDGTLFVNVGSATDHCERADDSAPDPAKPCPETQGTPPRGLDGRELMTWHGYRDTGHRVVALAIDDRGVPQGKPQPLVSGWDAAKGIRPQGAPVGLAKMADGSVLISEDHNGTLLRLARAQPAATP